jgi:predicted DNA-binding transcriptional regulator YafY
VCSASGETGDRLRVFKVDELVTVRATEDPFARPRDFNLERSWRTWCERIRQDRGRYTVVARVSPQMHVDLPLYLGEYLARKQDHYWAEWPEDHTVATESAETEPDPKGDNWMTVILHFDTLEGARTKLLGLGAGVEVMTPVALRRSLLDYAQQVVNRYSRH